MKSEIEIKLINALKLEIMQTKEARINGIFKRDIQILKVEYIQPIIVSPNDISKENFENAKVIRFEKGQMRLSRHKAYGSSEDIYYFDGDAKIDYLNSLFIIELTYISIYSN
jgi:hypothetical protein